MNEKKEKAVKPQVEITKVTIKKNDGSGRVYKTYEYKCAGPVMFRFGVQVLYKEYDNELSLSSFNTTFLL